MPPSSSSAKPASTSRPSGSCTRARRGLAAERGEQHLHRALAAVGDGAQVGRAQPGGLQAAADRGRHLGGAEGPLERVGRDEHRAVGHALVSHGCREGVHDDRGLRPRAARLEPRQGLLPRARSSRSSTSSTTTWRPPRPTVRGLLDRPTVLKRWRDGITGEVFFQKRVPEKRPEWLQTATVHFPSGRSATELVPNDAAHLVWGVNLGNIDWNPWPVRRSDLDHPDELRIDLDPQPGVEWSEVREVALCAGDVLREHGMLGFPKTSGSRGIHVYVRIEPRLELHRGAPRRARARARGRAPDARARDVDVVEGGARRRLPRLQPERARPHRRLAVLGARGRPTRRCPARCAGTRSPTSSPRTCASTPCPRGCARSATRARRSTTCTTRSTRCSTSRAATRRRASATRRGRRTSPSRRASRERVQPSRARSED